MDTNVDSQGFAVDHDGVRLEDTIPDGGAPFAISGAVFQELFAGSGKEGFVEAPHLEANVDVGLNGAVQSSSGGIHVTDDVTVEDYVSSDEEPLSPNSAFAHCKMGTSATVHAVLQTSKHERDALIRTRKKLANVLSFLKSKGFTEENVLEACSESPLMVRDDFGLPMLEKKSGVNIASKVFDKNLQSPVEGLCSKASISDEPKCNPDPFKDKLKEKIDDASLSNQNHLPSKVRDTSTISGDVKKSWTQVVNESLPTVHPIQFDHIQLPVGVTKISPPVEVLKHGNDKFKNCLVGTFSKGILSYAKVLEFAQKTWGHKGLLHVSQKDSHTFLFRFKESNNINGILARGTWFVERRPLILHPWG